MIPEFMAEWKALFARGKYRNYYHWLEVEAAKVKVNHNV